MAGKDKTERIGFTTIAKAFALDDDGVLERMLNFNASRSLQQSPASSLNEKTIKNAVDEGFSFRESKTQEWLRAFLTYVLDNADGDLDLPAVQALLETVNNKSGAEKSAPKKKKKRRITDDLEAFALDLIEFQDRFAGLGDEREALRGFYRLVRKTAQNDLGHYYEEPLFVGGDNQRSWVVTDRRGVSWGFTLVTSGIAIVVISHKHPGRGLGIRVIKIDFSQGDPKAGYPGIMLRVSENHSLPAASRVVLVPVADDDPEASEWSQHVEGGNGTELSSDLVRRIEKTDPDYSLYEGLELGGHLTLATPADWHETREAVGKINAARLSRPDQ